MKKRCCIWLVLIIIFMIVLSSCGVSDSPDTFDHSLYTKTNVVRSDSSQLINAPGMVFFMSQGATNIKGKEMGARLAYLNKKNHNSAIFCFDGLCEHDTDCIANTFHMASLMVYNERSGSLYTVKPEMKLGGAGSVVYKLDLQAGNAECIFEGNGNEIKYLRSYGQYIYILRQLTGGGFEVICHDTQSNKNKDMPLQENAKAVELIISGDSFYLLFADDIHYYRTDMGFSTFLKCEYFTTAVAWRYILGDKVYYPTADSLELLATQNNSEFIELDILTGSRKTVFKPESGYFKPLGIDDASNFYYCTPDAPFLIKYISLTGTSSGTICEVTDENTDYIIDVFIYDLNIYIDCSFIDGKRTIVYLNTAEDGVKISQKADPSVSGNK